MLLTEDREIDLFIGSRIGSFKHIKYHTDSSRNNKKFTENLVDIKTLQKDEQITCMTWGNDEQTEILIGRKNQQVQTYNTIDGFKNTYTADFGTGPVVGLGRCKRKLLAAVSSGVVRIWSKKVDEVVNTGGKLDRMRVCNDEHTVFGTGGEENDLKLWRIGEDSPFFTAKNLPHDFLQLRQPIWVSDLVFLPGEGGRIAAVCSRYGYVRLYDSRAQRRPVCNVEFKSMAATCIANSFDERQVLVGFGRGQLHQVDLRKGKPDKGFKGCVGAVTDIAIVPNEKLVASCSLDRHLRIHSFDTKDVVYKQYLTSKLSSILIQTNNSTPLKNVVEELEVKEEDAPDNDDLDQIFDNMETVSEKRKKKTLQEVEEKKVKLEGTEDEKEAIKKLLKSTEKKKRQLEKKKREKKAKSVFHNA